MRDCAQNTNLTFPSNFWWGAATASYQIEGGRDERGDSIWDDFAHGNIQNNENGDVACNHYNMMLEDVLLMKEMGLQIYRFSLSWSRIWPDGTEQSESEVGVQFYKNLLAALEKAGIKACITLYHWDLPSELQKRCGWLNEDSPIWFLDYAKRCFYLFDSSNVAMWITFNEPLCMCLHGYCIGEHAPGNTELPGHEPYIVAHNVLLAHSKVYRSCKEEWRQIGITLNGEWCEPTTEVEDNAACMRYLDFTIGWFAEPIFLTGDYPRLMRERVRERLPTFTEEERNDLKGSSDFFGLNWYTSRMCSDIRTSDIVMSFPTILKSALSLPKGFRQGIRAMLKENYLKDVGVILTSRRSWSHTHMDWPVTPWGLTRMLIYVQNKYNPKGGIHITENGVAVEGEEDYCSASNTHLPHGPGGKRISFVRTHLVAVWKAIESGADVRSFFLWSLMDNLEWAHGYSKRFGAYHVDFKTLQRKPKPVVGFYANVILHNNVMSHLDEILRDYSCKSSLDMKVEGW